MENNQMENRQANAEQIKKYTALVKTSKINLFLTPVILAILAYFIGLDKILRGDSMLPFVLAIMIIINTLQFFYYRHKLKQLQQSDKSKSGSGIERM